MSTEITINQDIVEINVTEEVITIEAPSGAYPLPSLVNSVFGRVGNVVAQEGDYTLTQIGDVTLTSPSNGQVLKYNGTAWVNSSDTDTGLTSVGLSMPSAFSVANSPLTANGTLSVTGAGTTAQYVRGDGTLATFPTLTGFVPYTGATADVDLGTFNLTADVITGATGSFASNGGSNTFAINHSSGSGIALNITKGGNGEGLYINKTSGSGNAATIIGTLNATTLVKSGGTSSQYLMADGSVSTLTNPVTGTGTTNTLPKFTGASTIGNSNVSDSGTLITLGSNTTISSGGLGIGTSSLGGTNGIINILKTITGATSSNSIQSAGTIQSDVTSGATYFNTFSSTQATSFTLGTLTHYFANQGTFGAGSVVTNQTAFLADATLIGATNNYGFRGQIPSGTNRWNIYMDGTANNYMAGGLGIGSTNLTGVSLNIAKNITGATTAWAVLQQAIVQSDANTNVFGFSNQINTQATSFTLSQYIHYNATQGTIGAGSSVTTQTGFNVSPSIIGGTINFGFRGSIPSGSNRWNLYMDGTAANYLAGNLLLNTTTDAGFRLDVNGTTRFIGTASSDTAPLGSELAAVTGTGTNWTLAGTNLNVGGYTHTVGSVVPLTTVLAAVNGTYYQIAYTITGRTTGSITINYGGAAVGGLTATGTTGPLASSTAVLTITPTTDFNGTVVLSIKTIGTSSPSSTFSTSASTSNIEVRASSSSNNTFIGLQTGRRNTTGTSNTFIGVIAGRENTTGSENTFIGAGSGQINTIASGNTFVGANTGANNIGTNNAFFGTNSGLNNTTGSSNTFLGRSAGITNTTGGNNTFVGRESGNKNTTGNANTFVGLSAGQENTTGTGNVVVGMIAGQLNTTGNDNSVVGYLALNANVGGSLNSVFGRDAGRYIANKSTAATVLNNSIMIGYRTSPLADSQTNQIVIGHDAIGLGSNTTVIGNSSTTITGLYGNIRLVSGMGTAPASATATGTTGDIAVTAGFIYVCTATNTWVRTALTTW
jgi:hypothetical protein